MLFRRILLALVCLLISTTTYAKKYSDPQISEVFVDTLNNQLIISGSGFNNPDVSLGEYAGFLTPVSSSGDYELVVELPAGIMDGDYKLTLSQSGKSNKSNKSNKNSNEDDYDLTIGAVGPAGATGAAGPQGDPGISGYQQVMQAVTLGAVGGLIDFELSCPTGKKVLGAGHISADGFKRLDVWRNGPQYADPQGSSWFFSYTVLPGGEGRTVYFSVICATTMP